MDDRTQQLPGMQPSPGATQQLNRTSTMGSSGMDPGKTAMGVSLQALELEGLSENTYACATESSRAHLLLMLKATGVMTGRRMPLNLALCIDRSGSMEGEPLDYVKRACSYVVDLLEPNDILSIITFEEQVDVLMPARRVINKALIKEHIQRIMPGNTTNLYDGMMAACGQISSVTSPGYLNRVLLLTDGDPTAGIKDFSTIVGQVGEIKSRAISITALGFGPEYNEELMAGIARKSGGNYYYISRPDLIPEVFRRELETLMTILARNVRVRISLSRGVQCRYVYGVSSPSIAARRVEFGLPDIERGSMVTSLCELEFEKHIPGKYRAARCEVMYDDTVSNRQETVSTDILMEFVTDRAKVEAGKNPIVQQELDAHLAARNIEKTMMGMRTQQLTAMGAVNELQRTRTMLIQSGRASEAQEVTRAMDALQSGGAGAEKTLIGTIYNIDQGKKKG